MPFAPGDFVHVAALGKGTVREVRNGGACLVEVHGRLIVATADRLSPHAPAAKTKVPKKTPVRAVAASSPAEPASASIDLHGRTVDEALEAVIAFLDCSLRDGAAAELRIIHGRSGGKIKSAVHAHLRRISSIRGFRLDPRNPGVTIVQL